MKRLKIVYFITFILLSSSCILKGQEKPILDSIPYFLKTDINLLAKRNESYFSIPTKRAIASLAIPGLGQALNKTYWKIPIFYTVWATLIGIAKTQHDEYVESRNAVFYLIDDDPNTNPSDINSAFDNSTQSGLESFRDNRRRERDYYILLSFLWYAVGVVDAAVTAHLSLDVTAQIKISPKINYTPTGYQYTLIKGIKINFKL